MTYRIHMEFDGGGYDYIDLSGDSIEQIRNLAEREIQMRNPVAYYSEKI